MKKITKLSAVLMSLFLLVGMLPISSIAYGSTDNKLIVTHLNTASTEGAGVILTPTTGETVSSGYNWWMLFTFDWNETDNCYKVTKVQTNANNSDKSTTVIPENGFVYAVNTGNNYSSSGGINYITTSVTNSYNYAKTLTVGAKAYVYNTDIKNDVIDNNGVNWYESTYVSNSYIKIGTPDATGTPYNPNNTEEILFKQTLGVTHINSSEYNTGMSKIFTKSFSTDISGNNANANYAWWKVAVFEWDNIDSCYVLTSINLNIGNNYTKQPSIPENGFALAVITGNSTTDAASANMDKIKVGAKAYVYGADLGAGTITSSAKICVNLPDTALIEYKPTLSGARLAAPTLTNMTENRTITTNAGFTIQWAAVTGATGYVVNVNNSFYVTDGPLVVNNQTTTGTSYAISGDKLEIGKTYAVSVYAIGTGKAASIISRAKLAVISEEAYTSTLRNKTIVAFGDSLTARSGWVNLLGGRFGADVINSGVGGDNTNQGKARFASQVVANNPDIVIINFGMNDQAVGMSSGNPLVSLDIYTQNLEYFASELIEADIDVVFVTPNKVCTESGYYVPGGYGINYGSDSMLAFCDAMRKVAVKYGCGLVDINKECEDEDLTDFLSAGDGIHQSTYGHEKYAEYIGDYLAAVYDNKELASVDVKYVDSTSATLADTITLYGAVGAKIIIPGKDIEGYASVIDKNYTFTSTNGTVTFQYATPSGIQTKNDSNFKIEGNNIFISSDEMNSAAVLGQIETAAVTCVNKTGSYVGTGSKIQLKSGDTVIAELTVILRGDASGDGKINSSDYLLVKRHFLETYTLTGEFLSAADVDGSGSVSSTDYLKVKRHFLGSFDIHA
ncbi:MAG: hypothetical protein A2Y15_01040 [Clostridiales bacterium GWF2_36_10]|nr:MAG: hypothetical protein A2Y15_01040 [Clostridiales bacterium GWF2_36_10]HAN20555.1 hypothetical protein [Clostridiales bacterium]